MRTKHNFLLNKVILAIFVLVLVWPAFSKAMMSVPMTTLSIIKNTAVQDGNFNFSLSVQDADPPSSLNFPIETSNFTGQQVFSLVSYGTYTITESESEGWQLENISCVTNSPYSHIYIYPSERKVSISPSGGESITCSFNNKPTVNTKTPVLIVPGIMGTELWNGDDFIWPNLGRMFTDNNDEFLTENLSLDENGNSIKNIEAKKVIEKMSAGPFSVNVFQNLLSLLQTEDYKQDQNDQNLFYFPYDWRLDLNQTKNLLNQEIEAIKLRTGSSKVDIIAHSMGGLLVKSYLNSYGNNSINKLIFVGTPHLGAPKAAKVLLEGDKFSIPWLEEDRMRDLALNSPSVYELLPDEQYVSNYQGYIKKYTLFSNPPFLDYANTADFLTVNKQKNASLLNNAKTFKENIDNVDFSGIQVYNIAGCKTSTQAGYQLAIGNSVIGLVGYASGDETVPLFSADYINIPTSNKFYVKNASHAELPSTNGVRELISGILANNITASDNVSNNNSFCKFKGKSLSWHSPVEVHIYSDGKHTGPIENNGIEYGIPGVNYDIIGGESGEKFIFLPTDEGQEYQISASGLKTGTFDLRVVDIDNGESKGGFVYNDMPINTSTPISFNVSENIQNEQIQVDNLPVDASAELLAGQDIDLVPPQTIATLSGSVGNDGWYKSNVQVSLTAMDDLSGVLITKYSVDNGAWQDYPAPFTVFDEGTHSIKYYSIDRAGNDEDVQTIQIKIDKTAPEFTAQFNTSTRDYDILAVDNIDLNPTKTCTTTQCTATDQAGNTTILTFQKQILSLNIRTLSLKTVKYNNQTFSLDPNLLSIAYVLSKNNMTDVAQTELIKNKQIMNILYSQKKNQSVITDLSKGVKPQITTTTGLKLLQVNTNKGILKTTIKENKNI